MRLRANLLPALLLVAGVALGAPAGAAAERARDAAALVDAVGVNIHSSWGDTAYRDADRVLAALRFLRVHRIRDGLPLGSSGASRHQIGYYRRLAAGGVRADLFAPRPGTADSDPAALARTAAARLRRFVASIEGPNEADLSGMADWAPLLRDYQARLRSAVRAQPRLDGVRVIGPSFGRLGSFWTAGPLDSSSDAGNVHIYPGGARPEAAASTIEQNLHASAIVHGPGPVYATEAGYHDALCDRSDLPGVSPRAAAAYLPRLVLELFSRGLARVFVYELVDFRPDPSGCWRSQHFGLFDSSFGPKPQAIALARLLGRLDGRANRHPGSLDVRLQGAAGLGHLLLQRADGTFVLALWQGVDVWDPVARRDLGPPGRSVGLHLPSAMVVHTQRPLSQAQPRRIGVRRSVRVDVPGDDLQLILLTRRR